MTPSQEHFPQKGDSQAQTAELLFEQTKRHAGMSNWKCKLVEQDKADASNHQSTTGPAKRLTRSGGDLSVRWKNNHHHIQSSNYKSAGKTDSHLCPRAGPLPRSSDKRTSSRREGIFGTSNRSPCCVYGLWNIPREQCVYL